MKTLWCLAAVVLLAGAALAVFLGPWSRRDGMAGSYQPRLETDPSPPAPPDWALRDFSAFLQRLRSASKQRQSLLLHKDGLEKYHAWTKDDLGRVVTVWGG